MFLFTRFFGWIIALAAAVIVVPTVTAQVLSTPQQVWEGYDPRAEPLEIEVLKKWTDDGINYTEMYFTGMTHEGSKVRVYAIYSVPKGGTRLPGVLHIHGGGQTVSLRWARYWPERGYAHLTFNYCGEWPNRDKYTLWGKLEQGNMGKGRKLAQATEPSVRASSWYLWTRIARRALTCLEQQPEVDPERLGIFGVSVGGSIVWPFAGTDRRIKAACAVYGAGWNTYPAEVGAPDPKADDPKVKMWRSAMEPESYAALVQCPILLLDGTNDHHGKMDHAYQTLDRVKSEHRQAFSPHWRHHIAAGQAKDLPLWMDTWLKNGPAWPKTPLAEVGLDADGVPRLMVKADPAQRIERVDCFYAVENRNPINRFWRSADSVKQGTDWTTPMPILSVSQPLYAFANVYYASGICLTSALVAVTPAKLGPAKATDTPSLIIDDLTRGARDWYTSSPGTDPNDEIKTPIKLEIGPGGQRGIGVVKTPPLHTHKVGDPKWRGPDGARLQFQVYAPAARRLNVAMVEKEFSKGSKWFYASLPLQAAKGWQTITLSAKDFKTTDGQALVNWRTVNMLELTAGKEKGPGLLYSNFTWVK